MTGLALLAFLGDGNTTTQGDYKEVVSRGVKYLKEQQDPETGLLGARVGGAFMYNHGIATLALCEAYYFSKNPLIKSTAQGAIDFILRGAQPVRGLALRVAADRRQRHLGHRLDGVRAEVGRGGRARDRQGGLRRRAFLVRRGHRPVDGPLRLPDHGLGELAHRARQQALPGREGRGDDRRGAALPLLPGPGPATRSTSWRSTPSC